MATNGYIMVNMAGIDASDFDEAVTIPGIYNLMEAAIQLQKPVMLIGIKYGDELMSPTFVSCYKDENEDIIIGGFNATVSDDDKVTPPEEPDPGEGGDT